MVQTMPSKITIAAACLSWASTSSTLQDDYKAVADADLLVA
jgi:hypothetical protein